MQLAMTYRIALTLALVACLSSVAAAQTKSAQAEKLFKDGKAFMAAQKYPEACTAFEGSQKLEPNISTLANLANCREKNGQIATAWGLFIKLEQETREDPSLQAMNDNAKARMDALEPRASYLIINVPDDSRVNGLEITLDGELVEESTWNSSLPIDGGTYEISGKAPGHEAWSTKVTVAAEQDKQSVDVPKFKSLPEVGPGTGDPRPPQLVDDGPPPTGLTGKRKLAIGLGAVGVVSLIAAGTFEVMARGTYDDATAETDDDAQRELTDKANGQRSFAIGFGIVGVVGAGVATYLWVTGARPARATRAALVPTVSRDGAGFAFTGAF